MLQTVTHELGHSLGLSHSDVSSAVMAPFYKGWQPNFRLDQDDIEAIQALYGSKLPKPTAAPTGTAGPGTTSPATSPGLCEDSSFQTIFRTSDGHTYVFRGDNYWRLTSEAVAEGYPRSISSDWNLPSTIQAAFTWRDSGATYLFSGSEYWKYDNMLAAPGYPKDISVGFPGIPADVDSAFVWSGNNKIYFFKGEEGLTHSPPTSHLILPAGSEYWKFDPARSPHVRSDKYPRSVSLWDLPPGIDGALQWDNKKTYFFKQVRGHRYCHSVTVQ